VGSIVKKDVLLKMGGYDELFAIAADYDLWSRLLAQGYSMTSTPHTLVAIRVHPDSLSVKGSKSIMFLELAEIIQRNFARLANQTISPKEVFWVASLFYDLPSLNYAEFAKAKGILKEAYERLKSVDGLPPQEKDMIPERQFCKLDVKRIFICIDAGTWEEIREIAQARMREYGGMGFFLIFWIFSYFGRFILQGIPRLYRCWIKAKAQWKARFVMGFKGD
jgi:hypothetical protein